MISPGHIGQSVAQATTYTKKISQAPDAVWIWSKGWNAAVVLILLLFNKISLCNPAILSLYM